MFIFNMFGKMNWINYLLFLTLFNLNNGFSQNLKRYTYSEPKMGTIVNLVFYASDPLTAKQASKEVFEKIETLNSVFSDYDLNSELIKLCNNYELNKEIKVSDVLFDILLQSTEISQKTNGAFDFTLGPITKMWRQAKLGNKLPSEQQLSWAKSIIGYKNVLLNIKDKTVIFKKTGMQIDLGGIAKGYTADEVLKVLNDYKIEQALIDLGGDITVSNPPPDKKGWSIEVNYLNHLGKTISEIISISNMAVATSGDYYQQLLIGGKSYSHIIDPSTGLGVTKSIQVTVIASSGSLADSYASAFSVMDKIDIEKLIKKNKNLHFFIISLDSNSTKIWHSKLYNNFLKRN